MFCCLLTCVLKVQILELYTLCDRKLLFRCFLFSNVYLGSNLCLALLNIIGFGVSTQKFKKVYVLYVGFSVKTVISRPSAENLVSTDIHWFIKLNSTFLVFNIYILVLVKSSLMYNTFMQSSVLSTFMLSGLYIFFPFCVFIVEFLLVISCSLSS